MRRAHRRDASVARLAACLAVGALALGCLTGCSAIVDVDRFERGVNTDLVRDFTFNLRGARTLGDQRAEVRLMDSSNTIIAVATIDGVGPEGAVSLTMPNAIPPGDNFLVALYADLNDNDQYDPPTSAEPDRAWEDTLPPSGSFDFMPTDTNIDLNERSPMFAGEDLRITLTGFGVVHPGQTLRLLVYEEGVRDRRAVGYYHRSILPAVDVDVTATIPGILAPGERYRIHFFADVNNNGEFDQSDHSWVEPVTGEMGGTDFRFIHHGMFLPVDF